MKERPILMTTESVKAILDGRKTMTRRTYGLEKINESPDKWEYMRTNNDGRALFWVVGDDPEPEMEKRYRLVKCPYGQVGDRLWVREMWSPTALPDKPMYRATPNIRVDLVKWKPSIFMPRWASRLTLEITEVRVERLQEITEADAKAEGVDCCPDSAYTDYRHHFMVLWDSINGKKYPWSSNPWVWVIKFDNIGVRVK